MSDVLQHIRAGRYADLSALLGDAGGSATPLARAQAAWELGLGDRARDEALQARRLGLRSRKPAELAAAYLWIARIEIHYGDPHAATVSLRKAREVIDREGSAEQKLLLALVNAEWSRATKSPEAAAAAQEVCLLAEGARDAEAATWSRLAEAWFRYEAGDPVAARRELEPLSNGPAPGHLRAPDLAWRLRALECLCTDDPGPRWQEIGLPILAAILDQMDADHRAPFLQRADRARLLSALGQAPDQVLESPLPTADPVRDLRMLSRIIRAMNTETRTDVLLRLIVDSMLRTCTAESGILVLLEEGRSELCVRRGHGGVDLAPEETPISLGIAREAASTGRSICLEDAAGDARWSGSASVMERGLRSILCVPIRFRGRPRGAIFLECRQRTHAFGAQDRALAEVLADQAAVAIENALLFSRSITDPLTETSTHAHFERRLTDEVDRTRGGGHTCGLLLVDLDRFKHINDTFGHDAGSRILQQFVQVLRAAVRTGDVAGRAGPPESLLGRYGGDEFEILLPHVDRAGLTTVADRIRTRLHATRFECAGTAVEVTASIGGATCPQDAANAHDLFLRADEALYEAKRSGRDRFAPYREPQAREVSEQEIDLLLLSRYGHEVVALLAAVLDGGEDLQATLDRALQATVRVTGAERGFIVLSEARDRVRLHSAFRFADETFSPQRFRLSFGVIAHLVQQGMPLCVSNPAGDPRFQGHQSVLDLGLASFVAVPIPGKDGPLGILYLDSTSKKKSFTPEDEVLLTRFSRFLGKTLELGLSSHQLRATDLPRALDAGLKDLQAQYRFDALIGDGAAIRKVRVTLDHVSPFPYPVLILGETGTGKEIAAKAIHANSPRKEHPLVAVNCAALSRELLESELFGHVRGAFTGADRERPGLFAAAHKGTLFLDEIGETSEDLQRKLLRVLQEHEFLPVGGSVPQKCDVRIVAATHRGLEREVREGRFREDLYYRLKVFPVTMPALRDRPEDLPVLARHLLDRVVQESGTGPRTIEAETLKAMSRYAWPGNVRELENAMRHAVAFSAERIAPEHLPPEVLAAPASTLGRDAIDALTPSAGRKPGEEMWKMLIEKTLREVGWNQSAAAKELGITRATLRRKIRAFGLQPPTEG